MYNDIYTVYRSGCGCESRAEQIVYYDDSDVTGAWPMRVLSSNLCVTRENASNNSPVCHRKPLLSPHNPLQQPQHLIQPPRYLPTILQINATSSIQSAVYL